MGARIDGAGSSVVTIEGVAQLRPCSHRVIPDRIEAGTLRVGADGTTVIANGRQRFLGHVAVGNEYIFQPLLPRQRQREREGLLVGDAHRGLQRVEAAALDGVPRRGAVAAVASYAVAPRIGPREHRI